MRTEFGKDFKRLIDDMSADELRRLLFEFDTEDTVLSKEIKFSILATQGQVLVAPAPKRSKEFGDSIQTHSFVEAA